MARIGSVSSMAFFGPTVFSTLNAGAPRCQVVDLLSEGTRSFNQQKLGVQIEPTEPTCNK